MNTISFRKNKTASSLVLLAVLFLISSCISNKPEEIKAFEEDQNIPSLELEDFESFITDSGKVQYHIITPELLSFDNAEEPYREFPKGGHIISYGDTGQITSEIKCKYATNNRKNKLWDLRNNVEAINEEGVIFNSEQLYWDELEKRIYTDKFIKITTKDKVITGYGLEATQNLKEYEIGNISAVLGIDEDKK